MAAALRQFVRAQGKQLGMVSIDIPLISNLTVLQNIALIKEYHSRISRKQVENHVLAYLEKMNLPHIADKRNPALTHEERFCALVLRAVMVEENIVVIDRPFSIMPNFKDSRYITNTLRTVNDLLHKCHIFDYIWHQDRYGEGWA